MTPEPVATQALHHLLHVSEQARAGMSVLVESLSGPVAGPLRWSEQVSLTDHGGGPDLVGVDRTGVRVVLEAKFDANLTAAQRTTAYLDHLDSNDGGLLVFVAPDDRLSALWDELLGGPGSAATGSPMVSAGGGRVVACSGGRTLALTSWRRVLDALTGAIADVGVRSDLEQLRAFAEWQMRHEWPPVGPDDLDRRVGRQIQGLFEIVVAASKHFGPPDYKKPAAASGDDGPGRYITATASNAWLWFGFWPKAWSRFGTSPLWVWIRPQEHLNAAQLDAALHLLPDDLGSTRRDWGDGAAFPVAVPLGGERDDVVDALVTTAQRVLDCLAHAVTAATTPAATPPSPTSPVSPAS